MQPDCLFCSIIRGDIPAQTVLDRERVLAFRDIAPAAPVHVLIVPKEHIRDAAALDADSGAVLGELVDAANAVARAEGIDGSGYRLLFNVGPDAGQTVLHLHLHLLGGAPLGGPGPA